MSRLNKLANFLKNTKYISDIHTEKNYIRNVVADKPNIILAGDIGYPHQESYKNFLHKMSYNFDKVFVISGNHEYDGYKELSIVEDKIKNICYTRNNLYYLQKETYLINPSDNLYIAGCTLWAQLPFSKRSHHYQHIYWIQNLLLENKDKDFIIATHHAPLYECLHKNLHSYVPNYFASNQEEIIKLDNMLAWIHGHTHINKNINIYDKWILSNQYGSFKNPGKGYVQ
jgi:predicted phosphodiesterase